MIARWNPKLPLDDEIYKALFCGDETSAVSLSLSWKWLDRNEKFCQLTGYARNEPRSGRIREIIEADEPVTLEKKPIQSMDGLLQKVRNVYGYKEKRPLCSDVYGRFNSQK